MHELSRIAEEYFHYMGRHFPQQCASDEFYFFPRSEHALHHLDTLDDLTPEKIQDHTRHVQRLLEALSAKDAKDLDEEIDRQLLRQSMATFIREFGQEEVWRKDPTLYVKIPLFATGRILSQRGADAERLRAALSQILEQIPPFLRQGRENLSAPPGIHLGVAVQMSRDALRFHQEGVERFVAEKFGKGKDLIKKNAAVKEAWKGYEEALCRLSPGAGFAVGRQGLREILLTSLGYSRSPEEILETARRASQETEAALVSLAREVDRSKGWRELLYETTPRLTSAEDFMGLYEEQVKALRRFFQGQEVLSFPPGEEVAILQTPPYLHSLRATASYSAPLPGETRGHGTFYLTPGKEDLGRISAHCPYLSAHETYPGHHILDHLRMHHPNPVRRQVESPLFYEGWACYGEQLLDELGYIQDPRQKLIGLKRQLWRSLRAELDVKLQTGRIRLGQAAREIEALGFSSERARRQVRRFAMTPGYQLCYFMGNWEILRLRDRFSGRLGLRGFHDTLLGGGEIPFHLVEKRMKEKVNAAS